MSGHSMMASIQSITLPFHPVIHGYDFRKASTILGGLVTLFFLYQIFLAIYRLFFHPLAKYPGPKLAAVSDIWFGWAQITGRSIYIFKDLHEKYGPIIRVGPNDLSFATTSSYRDINLKTANRKSFPKTEFYEVLNMAFKENGIASERSVESHARKRKLLAPGFSPVAVREYEPVVQHHLDKFCKALAERANTPEGLNMSEWFHFLSFDQTGDIVFGEDFGAIDGGKASQDWVTLLTDNIDLAAWLEAARRFPVAKYMIEKFAPAKMLRSRRLHMEWSKAKAERRFNNPPKGRHRDALSYVLAQEESKSVTRDEIASHGSQLILGGSEALNTFFTSTFYYLHKTPRALDKLVTQIRSAYKNVDEITEKSLSSGALTYVDACIKEGLRMFPPAPIGLPRYSPGETVDGEFIPAGTRVSTHTWTMSRSSMFWDSPDEYRPERWLDPNNKDVKEASQPFMLGPRGCSGQQLAWMSMRLGMAKMFYQLDFELVHPDQDFMAGCGSYALWMKPPLYVRAKVREGLTNGVGNLKMET